MLLVCRKKKIQAFSCKLKQKASLQAPESLKGEEASWKEKKNGSQSHWVTDLNPPVASNLLSNISTWRFPLQRGSRWDCSSLSCCSCAHYRSHMSWQLGKRKKKSFSLFLLKSPVVFLKSSVFVTRGRWSMEAAHWKIQSCIIFLSVSPSHLWLSRR